MLPPINISKSALVAKKQIALAEMKVIRSAVGKTIKTKKKQLGQLVLGAGMCLESFWICFCWVVD